MKLLVLLVGLYRKFTKRKSDECQALLSQEAQQIIRLQDMLNWVMSTMTDTKWVRQDIKLWHLEHSQKLTLQNQVEAAALYEMVLRHQLAAAVQKTVAVKAHYKKNN